MIIDILVLIVVLLSALIAFLRGFIREVLTIAGVLGGMAAAYYMGPSLSPTFRGWLGVEEGSEDKLFGIIPYEMVADGLAYASIFILVVIILSIISHFIAEKVKSIGLGAIDRTLGVIFGIIRGVLLLAILYLPVHLLTENETKEEWFKDSKTHVYLEQTASALADFLPEDTRKSLEKQAEEIADNVEKKDESARGTLEKMELLNKDEGKAKPNDGTENKKGYTEQFREEMDQLFEENDATKEQQ